MTDYTTTAAVKAQIEKANTGADTVIAGLVTAMSRAIDRYCNRPVNFFVAGAASARLFRGSGNAVLWLDEMAVAPTLVEVKDSVTDATFRSLVATDYLAAGGDPTDPDFNATPYEFLIIDPAGDESRWPSGRSSWQTGFRPHPDDGPVSRAVPTIRVTAQWGYSTTVPPEIAQACIILAARAYKRGQGSWSDSLASADAGMLLFRKVLDPDVEFLLKSGRFIKPAVGRR